MKKTILVPVDLSGATVQVCNAARDLALALDARLLILHAIEPQPLIHSYYALAAFDAAPLSNDVRKRVAARMQSLGSWFRRSIPETKVLLHTGAAAHTILRVAALARVDYLVLGSHGHTAAYELFAGSVAHEVMRKAPCPVVLVPIASRDGPTAKHERRAEASLAAAAR